MNPELLHALRERISVGKTRDEIVAELRATGYDESTAHRAYEEASNHVLTPTESPTVEFAPETMVHNDSTGVRARAVVLPNVSELISEGWRFTLANPTLLWLVSFGLIIVPLFEFIATMIDLSESLTDLVVGLGSVAGFIMSIIATGVAIYLVSQPATATPTFLEGRRWLAHHLLAYVIMGIMSFFLVTVYSGFTYYVMARYNQRYLTAFTWSHVIVRGYWWEIVFRLLALIGLAFLGGIVIGIVSPVLDEALLPILSGIAMTLYTPFSIGFSGQLFRALTAQVSEEALMREAKPLRKWYIGLMVLGPVGIFLAVGAITAVAALVMMGL
jgi:hypothetical protein